MKYSLLTYIFDIKAKELDTEDFENSGTYTIYIITIDLPNIEYTYLTSGRGISEA